MAIPGDSSNAALYPAASYPKLSRSLSCLFSSPAGVSPDSNSTLACLRSLRFLEALEKLSSALVTTSGSDCSNPSRAFIRALVLTSCCLASLSLFRYSLYCSSCCFFASSILRYISPLTRSLSKPCIIAELTIC